MQPFWRAYSALLGCRLLSGLLWGLGSLLDRLLWRLGSFLRRGLLSSSLFWLLRDLGLLSLLEFALILWRTYVDCLLLLLF